LTSAAVSGKKIGLANAPRQPHDRALRLISGGADRRRLGDVVEAQGRHHTSTDRVEDRKREQRVLVGRQRDRGGADRSRDEERRTGPEPVDEPAADQGAGAADHQHAAEDRSQRRRRPPRAGVDRVDQHPIGVVGDPVGDDRDQAKTPDRQAPTTVALAAGHRHRTVSDGCEDRQLSQTDSSPSASAMT
jgi:hypothetical protein